MSALGTINCHFREGSKDRFDFLMRQISAELPALLATLPRAPTYQGREGEVTTIQNIMECWEQFADIDWLAHTILDFQEVRRPCWVPGYCAAEELRFVSSVRWLLGEAEPALCGLVSSSRYCCI